MRNLKSILVFTFLSAIIYSCNNDNEVVLAPVVATKVENLHAPVVTDRTVNPPVESGSFTKFSFKTGGIVTDNSWDIAIRGTKILVNGGEVIGLTDEPTKTGNASLAIENGTFQSIVQAPEATKFAQDANGTYALPTGSGKGWYTYNPMNNQINPIAGKVIVIKTIEGNYVKMEIISYYKDLDATNPANGRYYTFNYVYNPNVGDKSFE